MKNAALCFLAFVVCVGCCGCGNDTSTEPSSQSTTAEPPSQLAVEAPEIPVIKPLPAQSPGIPVVKAQDAPWSRAREFEWKQGQPGVMMMHRDEGFAYLTGVRGGMPGRSEVSVMPNSEGNWKLDGSDHQNLSGRGVACPWFVDAEWPLEMKVWKTNKPDYPKLIHQRDGFCVLLKVGGRLAGRSDEFRLHVDENGYWRLRARSKSRTTRVQVAIIKSKQPGSFQGESREHTWNAGDKPLRLIHSDEGIAFLSGLTGTLAGQSDYARVRLDEDGYWYLEGRSVNKSDIIARAMTIRMSETQRPPPELAANNSSSSTRPWPQAKQFEWKHGQPAVKMNHHDDGIALLTGVQGKLIPTSEVGVVQNPQGDWLLEGTPSPSDLSGTAVAVPFFAEIERPHQFESWRISQGSPKLNQMIRQEDGFCAFQMIGGHFRGSGEQYRLLLKDGYWRFNARSQSGGTRTRILIVKLKQPGSFNSVVREHHWAADNDQGPIRMIHGNDGFAFLTGIGGSFESNKDYVRVTRHEDGYWYLEGGSSKRDIKAWAFSVQLSQTETTPTVASNDPSSPSQPSSKSTPPTSPDQPKPPSKADQAIAALKTLGFDVSEDGTDVDIGYSGGDKIRDDNLVHLRSLPDVTELGLYDVPFTDTGVQHLSGLTKLQHLRLGNSQISDEGLKAIGGLKNLETLDLGECKSVTGAGLMHLEELTNLRELSIIGVETRAGDLAFANGLLNLEQFDFPTFGDVLNESDLQVLGRLTKLTMLSLNGSEIVDNRTISHLSNLKSLTYLVLNDTRISDRAMQTVKELPRLRVLKVSRTKVDDLGMRNLAGMESLEELHLSGSRVGSRGISLLADCPNLTELFLQGPDTTDRPLAGLKDSKQLKNLYLNGDYDFREKRSIPTRITLNGIRLVSELEQLELLHLTDNPQITDAAVPYLSKMKNLRTLKLEGTSITPQGGRKIADEIEGLDYDDLGI